MSRYEGFGEKMRKNKMARKCTTILVSCICHHTINSLSKTFWTKFWTPHILRTWIYPNRIFRIGLVSTNSAFETSTWKSDPSHRPSDSSVCFLQNHLKSSKTIHFKFWNSLFANPNPLRFGVHIHRNYWTTLFSLS